LVFHVLLSIVEDVEGVIEEVDKSTTEGIIVAGAWGDVATKHAKKNVVE
jgi:hypothetical protein